MKISEKFSAPIKAVVWGQIPVKFDTPESYFGMLGAEQKFIFGLAQKVTPTLSNEYAINIALDHIRSQIDQAISQFQQAASTDANEDRYKALIAAYGNRKSLVPGSSPARFLSRMTDSEPEQALRTAICFYDVPVPLGRSEWGGKWARAAAAAEALIRGWRKDLDNLDSTLSEFSQSWDARFASLNMALSARLAEVGATSSEFSELLRVGRDDIVAALDLHKTQLAEAISDGQAQIAAIRETYKAELTLQAPTTYWKAKQISHRWVAAAWAAAFCVAAICAAKSTWWVWNTTAEAHITDKLPLPYGYFLPTLGAAFLSVWILRILSRQLLSNLSLCSDAGERVAMVKTFLALMQKPDHVKEPDRVLILSALFRSAGKAEDDGTPPNWFDVIMQRTK